MESKGKVKESSVVSKTVFVKNPEFEVLKGVEQRDYVSKSTKRTRWMVPVTEEAFRKFTPEMKKCVTIISDVQQVVGDEVKTLKAVAFVHVNDKQNLSGKVQFGVYPWSKNGLKGFFNVAADEKTEKIYETKQKIADYTAKCEAFKDALEAGAISDEEYRTFCELAKSEILK
ncbi:MAG: hypothetical protein II733_02945 [Succinivibrio sp.]|nr:hypothetical protein [Succinivibrio sp.]